MVDVNLQKDACLWEMYETTFLGAVDNNNIAPLSRKRQARAAAQITVVTSLT